MAATSDPAFDGVHREHVLSAVSEPECQLNPKDEPVMIYLARRYSARQVMKAAMQHAGIDSQRSGRGVSVGKLRDSQIVQRLRECGFTAFVQDDQTAPNVRNVILEILDLQREWTATNTPAMDRRGQLIRNKLPQIIRARAELLEPFFSRLGYSMEAEGSDGVGRKVVSPWTRVYDDGMSPSATRGWYIVLHFERTGDAMYVTLGCGATRFVKGEFVHVPPAQLKLQVAWARSVASGLAFPVDKYADPISLHGNALSAQFESATAFARRMPRGTFDEAEFWGAMSQLSGLLATIYEEERKGRAPLAEPPEVESTEQDIERAISVGRRRVAGQGRGLTPAERVAVERRAMTVAETVLSQHGFTDIEDVSLHECFDFAATRDGIRWCVEVKGTTSPNADIILMTANEVALHQRRKGSTALVLVAGIDLTRSDRSVSAVGGLAELLAPWDCDLWAFEPTVFRARREIG